MLEWKRGGGERARHQTPAMPSPQDLPPLPAAKGVHLDPGLADAAAAFIAFCAAAPEAGRPGMEFAVAFSREVSNPRSSAQPQLTDITDVWLLAHKHYSQLWVARAAPAEPQACWRVQVPLDIRKMLAVISALRPISQAMLLVEIAVDAVGDAMPLSHFQIRRVVRSMTWDAMKLNPVNPRIRRAARGSSSSGADGREGAHEQAQQALQLLRDDLADDARGQEPLGVRSQQRAQTTLADDPRRALAAGPSQGVPHSCP